MTERPNDGGSIPVEACLFPAGEVDAVGTIVHDGDRCETTSAPLHTPRLFAMTDAARLPVDDLPPTADLDEGSGGHSQFVAGTRPNRNAPTPIPAGAASLAQRPNRARAGTVRTAQLTPLDL